MIYHDMLISRRFTWGFYEFDFVGTWAAVFVLSDKTTRQETTISSLVQVALARKADVGS